MVFFDDGFGEFEDWIELGGRSRRDWKNGLGDILKGCGRGMIGLGFIINSVLVKIVFV